MEELRKNLIPILCANKVDLYLAAPIQL